MSLKQVIIIELKCHSLSRILQTTRAKSSQSLGKNNVGLNRLLLQHDVLCKNHIFFQSRRIKRIAVTDAGEIKTSSCSGFRFCENWSWNGSLQRFISAVKFWRLTHKLKLHREVRWVLLRENYCTSLGEVSHIFIKRISYCNGLLH